MINWDLYERRLNINGNTQRERMLVGTKNELLNQLSDSLSCKSVLINGNQKDLIINSAKSSNIKSFNTMPNDIIYAGDLIFWSGGYWLVDDVDLDNEVSCKGTIQQCNYTLNFQNNSAEVFRAPCIVDDKTTLNTGEKNGKLITVPDTRKIVTVPYNENTSKLHTGKRIFIDVFAEDSKVYKITEIDRITKMQNGKGLWVLKCDEVACNDATDRLDLLIADYIDSTTPSPAVNCEIVYVGSPEIKVDGSAKTFTAKFFDSNNNQDLEVTAIWDISDTHNGKVQIKEQVDNTIKIYVASGDNLFGKSFTLNLRDVSNTYSTSLSVNIIPVL